MVDDVFPLLWKMDMLEDDGKNRSKQVLVVMYMLVSSLLFLSDMKI